MSTLLHVILDRAPALATLAQECKGCPGTLCKGCHGTEHEGGCPYACFFGRFLTGITNFSPDQTSVTAQTFTSTRPTSSPLWRTTSPVRSVATPEAFFGHEIHSMPAGASAFEAGKSSSSSPARDLTKRKIKSRSLLVCMLPCWIRHFS